MPRHVHLDSQTTGRRRVVVNGIVKWIDTRPSLPERGGTDIPGTKPRVRTRGKRGDYRMKEYIEIHEQIYQEFGAHWKRETLEKLVSSAIKGARNRKFPLNDWIESIINSTEHGVGTKDHRYRIPVSAMRKAIYTYLRKEIGQDPQQAGGRRTNTLNRLTTYCMADESNLSRTKITNYLKVQRRVEELMERKFSG